MTNDTQRENKPGKLLLLRHGQTLWSQSGQYTGRTDIPLTEEGRRQAQEAGRRLALLFPDDSFPIAHVFTSPLRRAHVTAQLAGFGDCQVEPDLAEFDYGPAEGRTRGQVAAALGQDDWDVWSQGPLTLPASLRGECEEEIPGYGPVTVVNGVGESAEMAADRTGQVIERALPYLEAGQNVLCVAHAHILRLLTTRWVGLQPADARIFELDTAHFALLSWHHANRIIERWNF